MQKLQTVELGRGLAAVSVVAFHTNAAAHFVGLANSSMMGPFQFGVDFFFVLSGFIIFHVHRDDIGRAALARPYLIKRFVRLYPLLWLVVLGWAAVKAVVGEAPQANVLGTSAGASFGDQFAEPWFVDRGNTGVDRIDLAFADVDADNLMTLARYAAGGSAAYIA